MSGLAAGGEGAEGFKGVFECHGGVFDERGCPAADGQAGSQKQRRRSGQSDNEMPKNTAKPSSPINTDDSRVKI